MKNFRIIDRQTGYLLPPSVDDWLPQNHLARFIVDIVDNLDLKAFENAYTNRGSSAYHPSLLLSLLIYGYANGVFSSRKIERATYDSVAFRFIAAGAHPDHDTLANFRKRFLTQIAELFFQVLQVAQEMKLLKLGTISLDGTKIHANASRHQALSYGYIQKLETQLQQEVQTLLGLAEQADQTRLPDGIDLPEEIQRREDRLKAIQQAKQKIEERIQAQYQKEQAAYQQALNTRADKQQQTGKKPRGKPPTPPSPTPHSKDQINLTDEQSRIMPISGGGFEQCYNAQAAVDTNTLLVTATHVTQAPNDKQQITPMLEILSTLPETLGKVDTLLADTGYYSQANITACENASIKPLIAIKREAHHTDPIERFSEPNPLKENPTPVERMAHQLKTKAGRALYALRKQTVEPVFGIIKSVMGFRQFSLRGLDAVAGEWSLVCLAWNFKRMASLCPK